MPVIAEWKNASRLSFTFFEKTRPISQKPMPTMPNRNANAAKAVASAMIAFAEIKADDHRKIKAIDNIDEGIDKKLICHSAYDKSSFKTVNCT